jgi:Ca-activated chloride channel family protein
MKHRHLPSEAPSRKVAARTRAALVSFCAGCSLVVAAAALLFMPFNGNAQTTPQDGRPRRTETNSQTPVPTLAKPAPSPPVSSTPPQMKTGNQQEPDDDVVRIETNLVNLNVRVIDRSNRPINNVRQEDFRVYEDGVLQPIQFFSQEEVPISYGLAVDTSGSLATQLKDVIEAAKTIISANKPGDETFLESFVDREKIDLKQDFTSKKDALEDALDDLYVQGGQTAVIDGVYLAAEHVAEYKKGDDLNDRRRRALIVVTDGEDRASFYSREQLFARLREEAVQIYVIGFVNELEKEGGLIKKSPRDRAVALLNRMASETGGRAFYPRSLAELPGIAQEISRDLRTQYVIGYNPTNKARDGSYRTVRVAVTDDKTREKRIALTRAGYYAPRDGGNAATSPGTRGNNVMPAPTAPPKRRNP